MACFFNTSPVNNLQCASRASAKGAGGNGSIVPGDVINISVCRAPVLIYFFCYLLNASRLGVNKFLNLSYNLISKHEHTNNHCYLSIFVVYNTIDKNCTEICK